MACFVVLVVLRWAVDYCQIKNDFVFNDGFFRLKNHAKQNGKAEAPKQKWQSRRPKAEVAKQKWQSRSGQT